MHRELLLPICHLRVMTGNHLPITGISYANLGNHTHVIAQSGSTSFSLYSEMLITSIGKLSSHTAAIYAMVKDTTLTGKVPSITPSLAVTIDHATISDHVEVNAQSVVTDTFLRRIMS